MRTLYASKHSDRFMSLLSIIPFISIYNIRWIYPFLGLPTRPIRQPISDSHTGFYCFIIISTVLFFIKSKITMAADVCACDVFVSFIDRASTCTESFEWWCTFMKATNDKCIDQTESENCKQLKLSKPFGNKIIEPFCKVLDFWFSLVKVENTYFLSLDVWMCYFSCSKSVPTSDRNLALFSVALLHFRKWHVSNGSVHVSRRTVNAKRKYYFIVST